MNTPNRRPSRVLFLDFDGCLHPVTHGATLDGPALSTVHFGWLPLLGRALQSHDDVVVVVHSTWRYEYRIDELREVLGVVGRRVVVATPPGRGTRASSGGCTRIRRSATTASSTTTRESSGTRCRQNSSSATRVPACQHLRCSQHSASGWAKRRADTDEPKK